MQDVKRDEIRLIQSVMALNKPRPLTDNVRGAIRRGLLEAENKLWLQIRNDFIHTLKLRNPKFVEQLFVEGCDNKPRKPVTIDHEEIHHASSKRKAARKSR